MGFIGLTFLAIEMNQIDYYPLLLALWTYYYYHYIGDDQHHGP